VTATSGATIDPNARPAIQPGFRLQWESAQNAYVLLYPEGMVRLNQSASEILKRCQGELTVAQIVADLERAFETTGLATDVMNLLARAAEKNWIELRS
jgi:pyrroloquinoline quinone biosynthesis protein D